eukprot:TRINITY_DN7089_c0_g1_i1.p1 TRINITY_DN7089_c0_g1~~TRINITY_DN7089_c0_g1_i1.p1  ORF type:complete len:560 (+),score=106.29 TRINITY_DN7089_c0_g1_i1:115-1794(+)
MAFCVRSGISARCLAALILLAPLRAASASSSFSLAPSEKEALDVQRPHTGRSSNGLPGRLSLSDYSRAKLRATVEGICMYELPAIFNSLLGDSLFGVAQPAALAVPMDDPPRRSVYDTNQFAVERLFYERFQEDAQRALDPKDCKAFYIPYFAAWDTCFNDTWVKISYNQRANRYLNQYLVHMGRNVMPAGRDHFIVTGRIEGDQESLFTFPAFKHIRKLSIEDLDKYENVIGIPYPTWFRFGPSVLQRPEAKKAEAQSQLRIQSVHIDNGCGKDVRKNLLQRMRTACDGKQFCSYFVKNWELPSDEEIAAEGEDGALGENSSEPNCTSYVRAAYTCDGDGVQTFSQETNHRVLVLSCRSGPCWLWGDCERPLGEARTGPLVSLIGSVRWWETDRAAARQMCKDRPHLCALYALESRMGRDLENAIGEMYAMVMGSTFCVNLPGDSPTRKGIFDALVLGCIPVITKDLSVSGYSWHLDDWNSAVLMLPNTSFVEGGRNFVDLLAMLEKMHPDEILKRQRAIRSLGYSLQYSLKANRGVGSHGPDAFQVIMKKMSEEAER